MTDNSDLSPEDVKKAQALADQLDPDTARAIQEGNVPVIQAIKRGARTDAEITQTLISMGFTTGLPPALQQMVNEQEKQNGEKRDAEIARAERTEKLLAGFFGAAAFEAAQREAQAADKADRPPKLYDSAVAREALFSGMTMENWSHKTQPEKTEHVAKVQQGALEQLYDAADNIIEHDAKLKDRLREKYAAEGLTGEALDKKTNEAVQKIFHATDSIKGELVTGKGDAAFEASADANYARQIAELPEELREEARLRVHAIKALSKASQAATHADAAKDANDKRQDPVTVKKLNDATDSAKQSTAHLQLAANAPNPNSDKVGAAYQQSSTALAAGAQFGHTKADKHDFRATADDNLAARKTVDAKLASVEHLAATTRDEYDDAPAPPERKSIDCARMTCSQLAPPLPEAQKLAANDPAPEPPADPHQPQKPAVPRPKNDGTIT